MFAWDVPSAFRASTQFDGVDGELSFRSTLILTIVHFSGYRTQQREERSSVAKKHQETCHSDLFQWWYLQDLCLWIRFVGGGEGFGFLFFSGCWACTLISGHFRRSWGWWVVQSSPDGVRRDTNQWHQPWRAWLTGYRGWERTEWYVKRIFSFALF